MRWKGVPSEVLSRIKTMRVRIGCKNDWSDDFHVPLDRTTIEGVWSPVT